MWVGDHEVQTDEGQSGFKSCVHQGAKAVGGGDYGCGCQRLIEDNPNVIEEYTPMVASGHFNTTKVNECLKFVTTDRRQKFETHITNCRELQQRR